MLRATLAIIVLLAGCGGATDSDPDFEAEAERLNARHERPGGPDEWDNCDVEGYGGIEPVHACVYPRDGYAPRCIWYAGKRLENGEWAPMSAAADGELGVVCVCNVSDAAVARICR